MSKALGTVLREARKAMKKTQSDVAEALGVSRAAVGQWENGEDPSTDNLIAVCRYLKIELQNAIDGVFRPFPTRKYPEAYDKDHIFRTEPSNFHSIKTFVSVDDQNEFGKLAHVVSMAHAQDSEMLLIGTKPLFYVPVQWINNNSNRFYALGIETNHADPAVKRGDYALVDSVIPPSIGDYVVVMLKSTDPIDDQERAPDNVPSGAIPMVPGYVGKFVENSPRAIVLYQPFPEKRISIEFSHISFMHRINPIPNGGKLEAIYASK